MFDLWWFNQSFNSLREDKETNKDQEKAIYKASQNFSSYISITVISIGFPLCDNTGNLQDCKKVLTTYSYVCSDVGSWKTLGVPVEIGGDNIPTYNRPSPVGIGLTDLPNMGGGSDPPLATPVPASLICTIQLTTRLFFVRVIPFFINFTQKYIILYKNCSESLVQIPARAGQITLPFLFPFNFLIQIWLL